MILKGENDAMRISVEKRLKELPCAGALLHANILHVGFIWIECTRCADAQVLSLSFITSRTSLHSYLPTDLCKFHPLIYIPKRRFYLAGYRCAN